MARVTNYYLSLNAAGEVSRSRRVRAVVVYLGCAVALAAVPLLTLTLLPVPQAAVAGAGAVVVVVLAWRGLDVLLWLAVLTPQQRADYRAARRRYRARCDPSGLQRGRDRSRYGRGSPR